MLLIRVRLRELLKEKGMTQVELSELTGIRPASISDLANDVRKTINKQHLAKIIKALDITDMNRLIELIEVEVKTPQG